MSCRGMASLARFVLRQCNENDFEMRSQLFPLLGFVQCLFGAITLGGYCGPNGFGQCLAHYIMGGAFIAYGLLGAGIVVLGWRVPGRLGKIGWINSDEPPRDQEPSKGALGKLKSWLVAQARDRFPEHEGWWAERDEDIDASRRSVGRKLGWGWGWDAVDSAVILVWVRPKLHLND